MSAPLCSDLRREIRVLAMMEAQWVTGPAKNLITFACRLRELELPGLPRAELSVIAFDRPTSPAGRFISALQAAAIPVHVIQESRAGDLSVFSQLRAILGSVKPDIFQTHNTKSHFLARIAGLARQAPWIAFHHGFTARDAKDKAYNYIGRWALRGAPHIVTVCRAFSADLCRSGIPAHRIRVRHNMVLPFPPVPADELAALRSQLRIPGDAKLVLTVGRLSSEKGHADLLEALALLPASQRSGIRLVIVGAGPERSPLERRARNLNLADSVIFAGHQEKVAPYYALADAFVLPSHSEGSPNSLLEAMAAGLPIVSTAAGGAAEIVSDEKTALVVERRNPGAIARALGRLLEDAQLAGRLAAAAQLAARDYTPESYATSLLRLYAEIAGEWAK